MEDVHRETDRAGNKAQQCKIHCKIMILMNILQLTSTIFIAVGSDMADSINRGKEHVKDTAQSAKESLQDTAESAKEKGKGVFEKIKDTLTPNN